MVKRLFFGAGFHCFGHRLLCHSLHRSEQAASVTALQVHLFNMCSGVSGW